MKALTLSMTDQNTNSTIYDVAEKAGVSIATVSRVINTPNKVRKETREKVLSAINLLKFEPKIVARERARKNIGRIGVITPFFTFPSFSRRLRGIASKVMDSKYEFTIYPVNSMDSLNNYFTRLPFSGQIDGVIIMTLPVDQPSFERLRKSSIPTLIVENHCDGFSSIEIDNFNGGKIAAEYFINKGHTKFAFIGNTVTQEYSLHPEADRLNGYRKTLIKNGFVISDDCIKLPGLQHVNPDTQIELLFDMDQPPTAIFAATDELALRVMKVARKKGIRIPEDIALIGFDDIEFAEYMELTTISQSLFESGVLAAERLISQIENHKRPVERTFLQLKLIERRTA